jgi:hypothetical protein
MKAITTGAPTTSPMKMVRFDQSISPTESSKTREADESMPGAAGREGGTVAVAVASVIV